MAQGRSRKHAVVVGGSYAGLCTAAALKCKGWDATVIERSPSRSRAGGGVVVQQTMAHYLERHGIGSPGITSVPAVMKKIYQTDGSVLRLPETARSYTAWDVLLREFEQSVGEKDIRRGVQLHRIDDTGDAVSAILSDGSRVTGDLLVAADGIGSRARQQLLADPGPEYAGYIAWRGLVDVARLSPRAREGLTGTFSTFTGDHTNIVAYEVPGLAGSVEPESRRLNWVWYVNVTPGNDISCLLIDATGRRKRTTVEQGAMRSEALAVLKRLANELLIEPFREAVLATESPFIQAIQDYQSDRLVFGRSVLIGDAASLVRPHLGSGASKAVQDAIELAEAVDGPDYCEKGCLRAWEHSRLEAHHTMAEEAKALSRRYGLGRPGTYLDGRFEPNGSLEELAARSAS